MSMRAQVVRAAGSRAVLVGALVMVFVLVVTAAWAVVSQPWRSRTAHCAMMPDSIGLYEGSHVTMRGIVVGDVTAIRPVGTAVRVDFDVDARYPVTTTSTATTVSNTVVADRQLAILRPADRAAARASADCITETLTPVSLSRTLDAVGKLAKGLSPDGAEPSVGRTVTALRRAVDGTGDDVNSVITALGTAVDSPDRAVGNLSQTIGSLSDLSTSISTHWGDITSMLTRMGPVLTQVNDELFSETVVIIDGFERVLPMLNDLSTLFSDPLFRALDASVPVIKLIAARIGSLRSLIGMTPALARAFTSAVDPATGRPGLVYSPASTLVPTDLGEQLCAATSGARRRACLTGRVESRDIAAVILGLAGAR